MVSWLLYTPFLIVFVGVLFSVPVIHADDENTIEASFSEIKPKIDGKFTTQSEWDDASVTKFQSNGYNFYLHAKQDRNFVYLMFDGVDFQDDPKDSSMSVRYQTTICFDSNNDKGTKRQPGDFCFTSTVNNEFGKHTQTRNAPIKFDSEGKSSHLDLLSPYGYSWGFGSQNNQFEESDHLMHEVIISKDLIANAAETGFTLEVFFDSAHDDLVQLVDGIAWPDGSEKENPSTWGTLFLPQIKCQNNLALIYKVSDMSSVCVTYDTGVDLLERGWGTCGDLYRHSALCGPYSSGVVPFDNYKPVSEMADTKNQFALDFYYQIAKENDDNIFFSPTSILTAFAIAYEGAQGNTATEMEEVFGFEPDDQKRWSEFSNMQDIFNPADKKFKLLLANALWLAQGFEPLQEYVDAARTHYDSSVDTVDFASDEGLDTINSWVAEKTKGKIEKLFEQLTPNTELVITNAIYFKGNWTYPFDEERTHDADFEAPQKTVQVPMMSRTFVFNYTSDDQVQVLELPYQGDKLFMLIILPNEVDGLESLEDSLTAERLEGWRTQLSEQPLLVEIPKFKLETDYDLIESLPEMGMPSAFRSSADFSGITGSKGLFIYQAIHKAFVDVNEEGTEAAAATGIAMRESMPPAFRADHPFMFLIQDNESDDILFMGRVTDPTQ